MGKSLTETAKSVLMKESNDTAPDRGATSKTPNAATLAPNGAGNAEPPKSLGDGQYQDMGPALVRNTDMQPTNSQKVSAVVAKDASKSSATQVPGEPMQSLEEDEEGLEEEYEVPAELREFIETLAEEGFSEEEIAEAIDENFELVEEEGQGDLEEEEDLGEESGEEASAPQVEEKVDMTEHVNAIFEGEDLSEDFKNKAKTIVEAAVNTKINEEKAVLAEQFDAIIAEEVEEIKATLAESIDAYLNYAVEEWAKENAVAIESSLRSELTEDVIVGLKRLFEENYIDIPEEKVSVVEELSMKVDELSTKLDEEIEKAVELKKQLSESQRQNVLNTVVEGLTATQAEKIKQLAESVDFVSEKDFGNKLITLRENYFPKTKTTTHKELDVVPGTDGGALIQEEVNGSMQKYVRALGTKLPN